jgi:lipid II:glycine glycyltransferase (peptidoglycan interpeptide bridge formation enzyme)
MVTIDRYWGGLVPYKAVFFPSDQTLTELTERSKPIQMARLFWTETELRNPSRVVRHEQSATVCVGLGGTPEMLSKEVARNTRYEIRQAEKLGDRVRIERNGPTAIRKFLALFEDFVRSKPEVAAINHSMLSRYRHHADIFLAYLDENPVCGHVLLRDREIGRARLLYSASRRFGDREAARLSGTLNRFLHWREICTYREEGFSTYDFGGIIVDKGNGITQFKMSFGGNVVKEHTYLCAGIPWIGKAAQALFEKTVKRARLWRPPVVNGEGRSAQS